MALDEVSGADLGDFFWNSSDLMSVLASDGTWLIVNPAWPKTMGWSLEDLQADSFLNLIHPDDVEATTVEFERLVAAPLSTLVEFINRQRHRDGSFHWIEWSCLSRDGKVYSTGRDVTERVLGQIRLAESLEMTRAILDAAPDSIIVIEQDLTVVEVSPGTERMYGIPQEQRFGRSALDVVHPDDRPATVEILQRLFRGPSDELSTYRFRARHIDGHWLTMETRARLLRDVAGRGRRAVLISRDISDSVAAQTALEQAKALAESHDRAKSEFMSRMSHELRTPMTAVLGFTEILQMEAHTPGDAEMLEYIHSSGRHLLALVDDVLDVSRVDSGSINLTMEDVSLSAALRECITLVTPQAGTLGITVDNQVTSDFLVRADLQRLKQVIVNLLTNAIKYNRPRGSVVVSCVQRNGQCRLSITDTGIGITPEKMNRLFTPFDRLDAEATPIEGTGLGLSLSRSLAEAMGGLLGYVSTPDEGSTFWVELPSTRETPITVTPAGDVESSAADQPLFREATILYVDDTTANLRLVELLLAHRPGYDLITSTLGRRGLDLAREHHPDLILLDAWLPDLHGLHVLRQLREDPATATTPVFVISADSTPSQERRFRDVGIQHFFTKPIDLTSLMAAIDASLAQRAA